MNLELENGQELAEQTVCSGVQQRRIHIAGRILKRKGALYGRVIMEKHRGN